MPSQFERACRVFTSRLDTLSAVLDKASSAWRASDRDPESLLAARLYADMHPLSAQVVFTAEQARQLAAFCANREAAPHVDPASLNLERAQALLRETRSTVQAIDAESDALTRQKTLNLQGGITLHLQGADYLDDFLIPNFYFHLVTAYDILRHLGVPLGKADYMAHLAAHVQRPG
jgi:hypothetical protein